ncbi:phosphate ABC transporter substrate-binding/OmpA family protein [Aestuariibius sp. 2305UL40-4]|uniref:phosphate ABC transporter substrate-binding/OmpA family protein n=1 Tax=Aestuariibius violaceus TaxID=3234132 RepID=UPI00345F0EB6
MDCKLVGVGAMQARRRYARAAVTVGLLLGSVSPLAAEPIEMVSRDGTIRFTGEIQEVEDGMVTIATTIGTILLAIENFDCIGADCPDEIRTAGSAATAAAPDDDDDDDDDGDNDDRQMAEIDFDDFTFQIVASAGIADQLLPVISEGIAEENGAIALATDIFGEPLPDDIGRPLPGGPRDDDDDDDDEERSAGRDDDDDDDDDEGGLDLISIRLVERDGDEYRHYGVIIEEEEEAIEALAEGEAEIIFLDEPAEPDDIQEVARGGGGNIIAPGQERVIAVEGLVVAVSPQNPIRQISIDDVPRVFSGEITNWSQLGGPNAPINVYSFDESNAAIHYVDELVLEPADAELGDDINVVQTMREMTAKILGDPNGIGVVPYANLRGTRAVPVAASCGIVNEPSVFAIKTEEYVMQRRFYAYNRAVVSPEAQEFLAYLDSDQLDGVVNKAGFVDLAVIAQDQDASSGRTQRAILSTADAFELGFLRRMLLDMQDTQRLSTTFRFAFGSSRLDVRARADVARIVDYIEQNQPREVIFVGFTDAIGSFEANARLAEGRAATVRGTILSQLSAAARGATQLSTRGYGELSPAACNEDDDGRQINRRVEIWVR